MARIGPQRHRKQNKTKQTHSAIDGGRSPYPKSKYSQRTFGRLRFTNDANASLLRHDTRLETAPRSSRMSTYCFCFAVQGTTARAEYTEFTLTTWRTYASIDLVQMLPSNPGLKPCLQVRFGNRLHYRWSAVYIEQLAGPQSLGRLIDWLIASFTYYIVLWGLEIRRTKRYRVQSGLMGIRQIARICCTKHRQQDVFLYDRPMLYGNLEAFSLTQNKNKFSSWKYFWVGGMNSGGAVS